METIKTYKNKASNKTLKIFADDNPSDPREWDNLGKMHCFHPRYSLGDKKDYSNNFESFAAYASWLQKEKKAVLTLPLSILDHSGLWMKVGTSFQEDSGGWDTSVVGYIWCSKEDIKKCYGKYTKANLEKARKCLYSEVETYNQYLTGQVYGFQVIQHNKAKFCKCCKQQTNESEEITDSCWGFFGSDFKENGLFDSTGIEMKDWEEQK